MFALVKQSDVGDNETTVSRFCRCEGNYQQLTLCFSACGSSCTRSVGRFFLWRSSVSVRPMDSFLFLYLVVSRFFLAFFRGKYMGVMIAPGRALFIIFIVAGRRWRYFCQEVSLMGPESLAPLSREHLGEVREAICIVFVLHWSGCVSRCRATLVIRFDWLVIAGYSADSY